MWPRRPSTGNWCASWAPSAPLHAPGDGRYVLTTAADGYRPQESANVVAGHPVVHDVRLTEQAG
ncbi:hypothetical protein ACFY6U_06035 [Streptomyces sp. NPDC013157]|uniref:hypothetical protein n=1 Tax=Streptomyces sp. NPDC013157 TaxID=3364861 RepID=UPI003681B0E4